MNVLMIVGLLGLFLTIGIGVWWVPMGWGFKLLVDFCVLYFLGMFWEMER